MQDAIGLIETKGLVALVEATDAMAKAANVEIVKRMPIGGGLVTDRRPRRRRQRAGGRRSRRRRGHAGRRTGRQPRHSASGRRAGRGVPVVTARTATSMADRRLTECTHDRHEDPRRQPRLDELQVPAVRHGRRAPACARRHRTDRFARKAAACVEIGGTRQELTVARARSCRGRAALPGATDRSARRAACSDAAEVSAIGFKAVHGGRDQRRAAGDARRAGGDGRDERALRRRTIRPTSRPCGC